MKTLKVIGFMIALLLLIGTSHEMAYQDEIAEEEFYCDMIAKVFILNVSDQRETVMSTYKKINKQVSRQNLVAKHASKFNKAQTFKDKTKYTRKLKHKNSKDIK